MEVWDIHTLSPYEVSAPVGNLAESCYKNGPAYEKFTTVITGCLVCPVLHPLMNSMYYI